MFVYEFSESRSIEHVGDDLIPGEIRYTITLTYGFSRWQQSLNGSLILEVPRKVFEFLQRIVYEDPHATVGQRIRS